MMPDHRWHKKKTNLRNTFVDLFDSLIVIYFCSQNKVEEYTTQNLYRKYKFRKENCIIDLCSFLIIPLYAHEKEADIRSFRMKSYF